MRAPERLGEGDRVQQGGAQATQMPSHSTQGVPSDGPSLWAGHAWGNGRLGFQAQDLRPPSGPGRCEEPVGRAEMGPPLPAAHGSQTRGVQVRGDGPPGQMDKTVPYSFHLRAKICRKRIMSTVVPPKPQ